MSRYVRMTAYAERVRRGIRDLVGGVASQSYSRHVAELLVNGCAEDLAGVFAGDLAPLDAWLGEPVLSRRHPAGRPGRLTLRRNLSCTTELVDVLARIKPYVHPGARLEVPDNTPLANLRKYADGLVRPGERLIHSLAADPPAQWARRMRRALRRQVGHQDHIVLTVWTLPWATAAQLAELTIDDLPHFLGDPELREIVRRAVPHVGATQTVLAL